MIEKIFVYGLTVIAVGISIGYLNRGTQSQVASTGSGQYSLKMNTLYGVISILGILLGLIIATMIILEDDSLIYAVIILFMFLGSGVPLFLLYKNHYLKFDSRVVEVKNFIGRQKSIQWLVVQNISFNHLSGLLTISDSHENKIKIHQHIVGFATFIKTLEEKTNWTAEQLRLPIKRRQ